MANVKDIRRRIRVVKSIEKITSAMKMVAAARLRKAQDRALAARPYAQKLQHIVQDLARGAGNVEHPLMQDREVKKAVFVVVGADRGLAGSFNTTLMNKAMAEIKKFAPEDVKMVIIGKKAANFFKRQPYEVLHMMEAGGDGLSFSAIHVLTEELSEMFRAGQTDAVYMVYAKFLTAMTQTPSVIRLLPMSAPETDGSERADFIYEPDPATLLKDLIPRYLDTIAYQAILESQASEQGARMTAMSAATKNAGEMIESLTLQYNKARQSAITKEITEIVSGAEALS